MAKDGTARGGSRYGSGRKKKPLADRVMAGETAHAIEKNKQNIFLFSIHFSRLTDDRTSIVSTIIAVTSMIICYSS